jgi:hypothetical protein
MPLNPAECRCSPSPHLRPSDFATHANDHGRRPSYPYRVVSRGVRQIIPEHGEIALRVLRRDHRPEPDENNLTAITTNPTTMRRPKSSQTFTETSIGILLNH